ncbi:outer membrane beta-barrel protein [Marinoscillum furvescens]|uniref:Carboxypeptidase-like protein n=1 Tax=Marinoscillum furvescens DSM 4134 TaxID=1122208 RepID=A0A3D9L2J3_MARFU|nr:outer membrane beta-barrel protein [Marinoscillum furvescens]RED95644.1 carboxypeptidase-like protein [Marinoscillum furvescens DSM 4134]
MKYILATLTCLSCITSLFAQEYSISGVVKSESDNSTFPGASVVLLSPKDSTTVKGTVTDLDGKFKISDIQKGEYILQANFVGFHAYKQQIAITKDTNLGDILLVENTKVLDAVQISAPAVAAMQKGDTSEFSAKAYKTAPDASSQELIEKLPGIATEDGKLQANGEDIQVILVDGKPFFGGDVKTALQNLPADVVASVQIFDKKSDKAALSGFDDGNQQKTINIITKPSRRVGQFGKSNAGVGTNGTYRAGASVNFFNNDRRVTVTGLSNNINTTRYTADPTNIGDGLDQNGLIKTNNIGINFGDDIGDKLEVNASYQFSHQNREENQQKLRDYTITSDSGQIYDENSYYNRTAWEHRFRGKIEYKHDEQTTFLMRPVISLKHQNRINNFDGKTTSNGAPINETENTAIGNFQDYDYNNSLFFSKKFDKQGRTLTTHLHTGWHTNEDFSGRQAENIYYAEEDSVDLLNQETTRDRSALSWRVQTSYTEPVGKHGMMELEYQIGDKINDSNKLTYELATEEQKVLDTALSNTFQSQYMQQQIEVGYQFNKNKLRLQVEGEYQMTDMRNDQVFPEKFHQSRVFISLLPSARVDYQFNDNQRVQFNYNTWTQEPSIGQLQSVIDNSNPLHIQTGNPDLDQSFHHWARTRFWSNDMETGKSMYASVSTSFATNLIRSATMIATEKTEVADGVEIDNGTRFTRPINVDGYYKIHSYFSYGEPVELLQSNFRVNGGYTFMQNPGVVNEQISNTISSNYRLGFSINSNISERLDFNLSTRSNFRRVENSLRPSIDNRFFYQTTRFKYRWVFGDGFVYRADLKHQLNTGLAEGYDNTSFLLNMSAGKKFLKDDKAEISINVYDLFAQNNNVSRQFSELYVEDRESTVLERYFMLTFTYNIRHFSAGTTEEDFKDI